MLCMSQPDLYKRSFSLTRNPFWAKDFLINQKLKKQIANAGIINKANRTDRTPGIKAKSITPVKRIMLHVIIQLHFIIFQYSFSIGWKEMSSAFGNTDTSTWLLPKYSMKANLPLCTKYFLQQVRCSCPNILPNIFFFFCHHIKHSKSGFICNISG